MTRRYIRISTLTSLKCTRRLNGGNILGFNIAQYIQAEATEYFFIRLHILARKHKSLER